MSASTDRSPRAHLSALSAWRAEWLIVLVAIVGWATFSVAAAPRFGGTDIYLFRDAAVNLARGFGFSTSSFEHSSSFHRLLYSSYTPGSLWAFVPAAYFFPDLGSAFEVYDDLVLVLTILAALWIVLPEVASRWRLMFVILAVLVIPVGFVGSGSDPDRPESLSFICLLGVAVLARRRLFALAGFLSGVGFLIQPFAGILGASIIGIEIGLGECSLLPVWRMTIRSSKAAVCFALPVIAVVVTFLVMDSQSLSRFKNQALVGGLNRDSSMQPNSVILRDRDTKPQSGSLLQKYRSAYQFHVKLGALHILETAGGVLFIFAWAILVATMPTGIRPKLALSALGLMGLIVPLVVFPFQGSYLMLGGALCPLLLLLNFGGCSPPTRWKLAASGLVALNLLILAPSAALQSLKRIESARTYRRENTQVMMLRDILKAEGRSDGVVVVPSTHYVLYKGYLQNIFDPDYLSVAHNRARIAAVAKCSAATLYADPADVPPPANLDLSGWTLLDSVNEPVDVQILGHKVMQRNWSWGCAIYVNNDYSKSERAGPTAESATALP